MKNISIKIRRGFFWIACLLLSSQTSSQSLDDSWVAAGWAADGTAFYFHRGSLAMSGFPPTSITAQIFSTKNGKSEPYYSWNFNCYSKQIVVGNTPATSISSSEDSIRNLWLKGFCGIKKDNNYWFFVGATFENNLMASYFIDAASIRRSTPPEITGVYFKYAQGSIDHKNNYLSIGKVFEVVTPCNGYSTATAREENTTSYPNEFSVGKNSSVDATLNLVCKNYFPLNENSFLQPKKENLLPAATELKNIENQNEGAIENGQQKEKMGLVTAKEKCKELGLKEKTEKFGACVLRLSK